MGAWKLTDLRRNAQSEVDRLLETSFGLRLPVSGFVRLA
jgi:hypothetical protein